MFSLVKQGKFKVGVVPVDRLGCLHTTKIFLLLWKGVVYVAMSAGANPTIFGPI
jgi:hypothetical protein